MLIISMHFLNLFFWYVCLSSRLLPETIAAGHLCAEAFCFSSQHCFCKGKMFAFMFENEIALCCLAL